MSPLTSGADPGGGGVLGVRISVHFIIQLINCDSWQHILDMNVISKSNAKVKLNV